jgi:hypothetical protein
MRKRQKQLCLDRVGSILFKRARKQIPNQLRKAVLHACLLAGAVLGLLGCASDRNATILPNANLGAIKNYYVVHFPSDNGKVNQMICDDLIQRGYQATTGEANTVPAAAEAVLTYQDKWMWDLTMYMLQLDIQIRNPHTDIPLATGMAMHTSLARRSPSQMVKEVLDAIYEKAGQASPAGAR